MKWLIDEWNISSSFSHKYYILCSDSNGYFNFLSCWVWIVTDQLGKLMATRRTRGLIFPTRREIFLFLWDTCSNLRRKTGHKAVGVKVRKGMKPLNVYEIVFLTALFFFWHVTLCSGQENLTVTMTKHNFWLVSHVQVDANVWKVVLMCFTPVHAWRLCRWPTQHNTVTTSHVECRMCRTLTSTAALSGHD